MIPHKHLSCSPPPFRLITTHNHHSISVTSSTADTALYTPAGVLGLAAPGLANPCAYLAPLPPLVPCSHTRCTDTSGPRHPGASWRNDTPCKGRCARGGSRLWGGTWSVHRWRRIRQSRTSFLFGGWGWAVVVMVVVVVVEWFAFRWW